MFSGIEVSAGTDRTRGIAEIVGGVLVLTFAFCVLTGRVGGARSDDAPAPKRRWNKLHPQRLNVRIAALAGPVTHIPGIFYLIALNIIIAYHPNGAAPAAGGSDLQRDLVRDPALRARGLHRCARTGA